MDVKKISSSELVNSIDSILDEKGRPTIITRQGIPQSVIIDHRSFSNILSYLSDLTPLISIEEKKSEQTLDNLAFNISRAARRLKEMEKDYLELLLSVSNAMDSNQSYLYGHNERVAIFASEVARQMCCSDDEIEHIRLAAILQNIGEITIPAYVLQKKSELEPEDWELIKNHPKISADIIGKIKILEPVVPIVYSHHEKFDGTGYPDGLAGEDIPLGSRIISVADTYDAMTNVRLHRDTNNHFEAISEIKNLSGSNFDPKVVDIFIKIF